MTEFRREPLHLRHDRTRFRCGVAALEHWLQRVARRDQERHVAAVYVLVPLDDPTRIAGFYSLSATSVVLEELPDDFVRKLPRYEHVPAILLGRLARDLDFPGLGDLLISDALRHCLLFTREVAAAIVIVDAKDDRAKAFYRKYAFEQIPNRPDRLFLRMTTLDKTFKH